MNKISDEFPLTRKWMRLISKIASSRKISLDECLQEASILEWELSQKIPDFIWRENYFKKCLYHRLYDSGKNWWERCRFVNDDPKYDVLDEIITMKSFNDLYYEDLVKHVCNILSKIDKLALELFISRIYDGLKWKEIRKMHPKVGHNRFYNSVKRIKCVVRSEVCV